MTIKIGDKEYERDELLEEFKQRTENDVPFTFLTDATLKNKIDLKNLAKFCVLFGAAQLLINIGCIIGLQAYKSEIMELRHNITKLEDEVNTHKSIDSLSTDIDNIWDYIINLQETQEWEEQNDKPVLKQEDTEKAAEA